MWHPHIPLARRDTAKDIDAPFTMVMSGERPVMRAGVNAGIYIPYFTNGAMIASLGPIVYEAMRLGFGPVRTVSGPMETWEDFILRSSLSYLSKLVPDLQDIKPWFATLRTSNDVSVIDPLRAAFTFGPSESGAGHVDAHVDLWDVVVPGHLGIVLPKGTYSMSLIGQIQQLWDRSDVGSCRATTTYYVPPEWIPLITVMPMLDLRQRLGQEVLHQGLDATGNPVVIHELIFPSREGTASSTPDYGLTNPRRVVLNPPAHPGPARRSHYVPRRNSAPGWVNFDTAASSTPFPGNSLTPPGRVGCDRWYSMQRCPEYGFVSASLPTPAVGSLVGLPPADPLPSSWTIYLPEESFVMIEYYDASATNAIVDHLVPLNATWAGRVGLSQPIVSSWGPTVSRDVSGSDWGDGFVRPLQGPGVVPPLSSVYSIGSASTYAFSMELAVSCVMTSADTLRLGLNSGEGVTGLEPASKPPAPPPHCADSTGEWHRWSTSPPSSPPSNRRSPGAPPPPASWGFRRGTARC